MMKETTPIIEIKGIGEKTRKLFAKIGVVHGIMSFTKNRFWWHRPSPGRCAPSAFR